MNPRTEALAFRIWAFASASNWDCSIHDIATALGETPQRIASVCSKKKWGSRLRSSGPFYLDTKANTEEGWGSNDVLIRGEEIVN